MSEILVLILSLVDLYLNDSVPLQFDEIVAHTLEKVLPSKNTLLFQIKMKRYHAIASENLINLWFYTFDLRGKIKN